MRAKKQATQQNAGTPNAVQEQPPVTDEQLGLGSESIVIEEENERENITDEVAVGTIVGMLEDSEREEGETAEDKLKQKYSTNYTINKQSFEFKASVGTFNDGLYPITVWTNNLNTLSWAAAQAIHRAENGNAGKSDYAVIALAHQSSIQEDEPLANIHARDGGDWANFLPRGDRKVRNARVNYDVRNGGQTSTEGYAALAIKYLSLGTPLIVRLWHSGLVFTINPQDKAEQIAMRDKLNSAHLDTLRRTTGLVYGTANYYANRIIVNEFMAKVVSSNLDKSEWGNILELIDHRDIPFMALALLSSAYPRGYPLVEKCGNVVDIKDKEGNPVTDADGNIRRGICGHTIKTNAELNLLIQIDNSMFTEWQKEFIDRPLNPNKKATLEEIRTYQSQGKMHETTTVVLNDNISVVVKAPKAEEHIAIGEKWIETISQVVDDIIGFDADEETRNTHIQTQMNATAAMDLANWVSEFIIDGASVPKDDKMVNVFRMLSNNDEMRELVTGKVREAIASKVAAICAVPTTKCPKCEEMSNKVQNNGTAFYTPIDVVTRFFILLGRNQ